MDNGSYIKLFRKVLEWEWYDHDVTKIVFFHLILIANWQETKWRGIDLHPGDVVRTNENLAKELKKSTQQVRNAISNLKRTGEVTVSKIGRIRIITIKNWDQYQGGNTIHNTKSNSKHNTKGSTKTTAVKESKEVKNIRSIYSNTPPTRDEVSGYCLQVGYQSVDVDKFMAYNEAKGWTMDWKKALDLWHKNGKDRGSRPEPGNKFGNIMQHDYDFDALEAALMGGRNETD